MKKILSADMSEYTTMRTGGAADVLLLPESVEELASALKEDRDAIVLGGCSNVIVRDGGIRGTVVRTTALKGVNVRGDIAQAMAGTTLYTLVRELHKAGLTGLEFASGIPGTVGGGVYMNAGAYGGEMKDFLISVQVLDRASGELLTVGADELELGYRSSRLMRENWIVVSADFKNAARRYGGRQAQDGGVRRGAKIQAASGIPQLGQHVQAPGGALRREADSGLRPQRRSGRRSTGLGKARRIRDKQRRSDQRRRTRADRNGETGGVRQDGRPSRAGGQNNWRRLE